MRASARTRVTFVPAKVTKTIRSGTPPCGFPAFLGKAGAKRTRSFAAQTPFCFLRLCLRYLVASSRILKPVAQLVDFPLLSSLLARRALHSLAGDKRAVSERSELASACQGCEAQSSRQAAQAGCLFLCLLSFGQSKERRVPRRTRRIHKKSCRKATQMKVYGNYIRAVSQRTSADSRLERMRLWS